jgi:hypothetical protein
MVAEYRYIIIELFDGTSEGSRNDIRARPLPNQWADPTVRVECPSGFRIKQNIGQLYKIRAKFKNTKQAQQLYSYRGWTPTLVSKENAERFIEARQW